MRGFGESQVQADREATEQAAIAAQLTLNQQKSQERAKIIKIGVIGLSLFLVIRAMKK